ncbi:caspase family protein [Rhizobium laguerreae]|uniref:caspase family protein n=1 Tax=Rhizobium laguerreae TaxID=1076926 RepID=UPI001C9154F6|nr:caspase family protein [Rhizobium laguerreae]MBY3249915.1 caspase family protein [Rhizobium laguerreae]
MTDKVLKVLGVHGLGDQRASGWAEVWTAALESAFPNVPGLAITPEFMSYDDIFETTEISFAESVSAIWKLAKSGVSEIGRRDRGFVSDISDRIKWTAGYVVAWAEDEKFQQKTRNRVFDSIRKHQPDIVLAHSLGSLITYNAFTHSDAKKADMPELLSKVRYVTFGSQIANPFVIRNLTNGRIQPLDVKFWYHLYNVHDDVFTAPIRLPDANNFSQTETPFDDAGMADHSAAGYLSNPATVANVWRSIVAESTNARTFAPSIVAQSRAIVGKPRKKQKALLVGINDYPEAANRLEGCVNDVFTMSAVLQDCGLPPESIRTCLDARATADGIVTRLKWLLDDPEPGDELVFYYSGHGARAPEYGENFEPDHYVETLVPWDFDWSQEKYIADDQIYDLYSQLPYDCRLVMIFDCCHSGGIHRDGGARPRGITPPDDIRHRELKWDGKTQMWVSRDFTRINDKFTPKKDVATGYFGKEGTTQRIGRASMLRGTSSTEYSRLKKQDPALAAGPYLPVIIEACGEDQLSYEYRHGATSHGAFTYSLANILRREKKISFEQLIEKTRSQLQELQYNQKPQILGPTAILQHEVPWSAT